MWLQRSTHSDLAWCQIWHWNGFRFVGFNITDIRAYLSIFFRWKYCFSNPVQGLYVFFALESFSDYRLIFLDYLAIAFRYDWLRYFNSLVGYALRISRAHANEMQESSRPTIDLLFINFPMMDLSIGTTDILEVSPVVKEPSPNTASPAPGKLYDPSLWIWNLKIKNVPLPKVYIL